MYRPTHVRKFLVYTKCVYFHEIKIITEVDDLYNVFLKVLT